MGKTIIENPYRVLGLAGRHVTIEEIRAAHRALIKQYHPDCNPSPEAIVEFERVQLAYDLLRHPRRRAKLDAKLAAREAAAARDAQAAQSSAPVPEAATTFSDDP